MVTTPEDVIVVENCEFTGLCQTISPGGRTVATEMGLETTTIVQETTTIVQETTTPELEDIPTPAKIFV